jgi:hypothetical protein
MGSGEQRLLAALMQLPSEQRAKLAHELLLSLDDEPTDADAPRARRAEERRSRSWMADAHDALRAFGSQLQSRKPSG